MKKTIVSIIIFSFIFSSCNWARDYYRSQNLKDAKNKGEAALLESENSKKVAIETAKANLEAAKLNAQAEIERAKGIAEANKIIGNSLTNNKAYLDWLWIDNIEKNQNAVYYVPTENKVPIFVNQTAPVIKEPATSTDHK